MKTLLFLALLWGITGCVTVALMPMEATDAPATYEPPRLLGRWMERESREKPRRREHVSGRETPKSACKLAPVVGGAKGALAERSESEEVMRLT